MHLVQHAFRYLCQPVLLSCLAVVALPASAFQLSPSGTPLERHQVRINAAWYGLPSGSETIAFPGDKNERCLSKPRQLTGKWRQEQRPARRGWYECVDCGTAIVHAVCAALIGRTGV